MLVPTLELWQHTFLRSTTLAHRLVAMLEERAIDPATLREFADLEPALDTLAEYHLLHGEMLRLHGDSALARVQFQKAAVADVLLTADIQEDIEPAPLDADGIYTCLANLVSNAIDACLLSGTKRSYVVMLSSREVNDALIYEVVDNGQGMDYETTKKVFTKFFSTKGSDRGTGLGLLTTKKIVHQHGGSISFTTEEGEGSTFRIELPRGALPEPGEENEMATTPTHYVL